MIYHISEKSLKGRDAMSDLPFLVLFLINQDEKLTVTQAAPGSGNPSSIRFQYQISERRSAFWDTALSEDSLFLEIPAGPLAEGSKEG